MNDHVETIRIKDLEGRTAIINGEWGLSEFEKEAYQAFRNRRKSIIKVDGVFFKPMRLSKILGCENIMFYSTGIYVDEIRGAIKHFKALGFLPKRVIFRNSDTALVFLGEARKLKKKGVQFFIIKPFRGTLERVSWI